jgi:hypothetical protein
VSEDPERRIESEDEAEVLPPDPDDVDEDADRLNDPELAEDLRRAQTNPPQTVARVTDPYADMDRGYLEDPEAQDLTETVPDPVELEPTDPLELERRAKDREGRPPGGAS